MYLRTEVSHRFVPRVPAAPAKGGDACSSESAATGIEFYTFPGCSAALEYGLRHVADRRGGSGICKSKYLSEQGQSRDTAPRWCLTGRNMVAANAMPMVKRSSTKAAVR